MKALNVTLMFNGNTETVFNFYKSVFGGEFGDVRRMKDIPGDHGMPDAEKDKILFMSLPLAGATLSGMDIPSMMPQATTGTNFTISLDMDSEAETTKIFNGLSDGADVKFPLGPQFWAAYFGMLTDKFGVTWMLTYNQR